LLGNDSGHESIFSGIFGSSQESITSHFTEDIGGSTSGDRVGIFFDSVEDIT